MSRTALFWYEQSHSSPSEAHRLQFTVLGSGPESEACIVSSHDVARSTSMVSPPKPCARASRTHSPATRSARRAARSATAIAATPPGHGPKSRRARGKCRGISTRDKLSREPRNV